VPGTILANNRSRRAAPDSGARIAEQWRWSSLWAWTHDTPLKALLSLADAAFA